MSVKVIIEIGQTATLKQKVTNGFTHDWELYVKGCDQNDISHFVEKVVFHLHASFPKPKRVIKEPPYCLKESGYAGFVLQIDIYLKNRDEPKKVTYNYDLVLQTAGPCLKSQEEKIVINTPSDEFRKKLLKGGGVLISNTSSNLDDKNKDFSDERRQLISKPKLGGGGGGDSNSNSKKYKYRPEDTKVSNTFANLFGTPINKTTKVSPDSKTTKLSPKPMALSKNSDKQSSSKEKVDKLEKEKSKHKHNSPYKDRKNDEKRDEKKKEKSHSKERERSREKTSKKSSSPKRSPKRISPPRSSSAASSENNSKLKHLEQNLNPNNKKSKKEKKDKDRDRENHRGGKEHKKEKDEKLLPVQKFSIDKFELKQPKENVINSKESLKEKHKSIDMNKLNTGNIDMSSSDMLVQRSVQIDNPTKKSDKYDKDSERKHKHKKKEKIKKDDFKEKDHTTTKEKKKEKERAEKNKIRGEDTTNLIYANKNNKSQDAKQQYEQNELKAIAINPTKDELSEQHSSDNDASSPAIEKSTINTETSHDEGGKVQKLSKKGKDKLKVFEKDEKRRKRKAKEDDGNSINAMDPPINKIIRRENENSTNSIHHNKTPIINEHIIIDNMQIDYMTELKELQHKIMTLQDNNELQRVVEMIAATGKFEITSKTFDFDLCTLDRNTVQQLQEFFATS